MYVWTRSEGGGYENPTASLISPGVTAVRDGPSSPLVYPIFYKNITNYMLGLQDIPCIPVLKTYDIYNHKAQNTCQLVKTNKFR